MSRPLRIGMVVGEASGDILGAGLMREIKLRNPNATFEGIGGPKMIAKGFNSHFDQERLAVMGFVEPFKRLPELLNIRKSIIERFQADPPDVFIGIDSPDFNLTIEEKLKSSGIKTVHYVSPSVWAWRQGRIKKIVRACDLMLTLFPFEANFYREHNVAVKFVGHPLANELSDDQDTKAACSLLGLDPNKQTLAIMPGSRESEVRLIAPAFLDCAQTLSEQRSDLQFIVPAANEKRYKQLTELLKNYPNLPITLVLGDSKTVMTASDILLIASGTTSLEAMLLGKPTIIGYKMAWLSFKIMSSLAKINYIGLPNLLADKALMPEFIQDKLIADDLAEAVLKILDDDAYCASIKKEFSELSSQLRQNASLQAANAVFDLIEAKS
ncbi:lipid-A-disaccharide synthase [Sessilibacter corallicola]